MKRTFRIRALVVFPSPVNVLFISFNIDETCYSLKKNGKEFSGNIYVFISKNCLKVHSKMKARMAVVSVGINGDRI